MIAFICFPEFGPSFNNELLISAQFCFINWFALYLPCALCHFTLSISFFFICYFFLQCPHLYICIVCMYIWSNCIYLYLNVYCQCLMLTVCTKGLRVTQFQFSVCMYCTCGRIDNKARLDVNKLVIVNSWAGTLLLVFLH